MLKEIALNELAPKVEARTVTVLEALPAPHFASGHIPSAINAPLDAFAQTIGQLPDRDAEIVVYCSNQACRNSHIAAERLDQLGYRNVRVFSGGKAAWRDAGFPLEA